MRLEDALAGADVFLGLSAGAVAEDAVAAMAPDSIIFALANPDPEVDPDVAHRHAAVVATGRSDYPEPDQQRAGLPRRVRGRVRRRRAHDHREHEAGRGAGAR